MGRLSGGRRSVAGLTTVEHVDKYLRPIRTALSLAKQQEQQLAKNVVTKRAKKRPDDGYYDDGRRRDSLPVPRKKPRTVKKYGRSPAAPSTSVPIPMSRSASASSITSNSDSHHKDTFKLAQKYLNAVNATTGTETELPSLFSTVAFCIGHDMERDVVRELEAEHDRKKRAGSCECDSDDEYCDDCVKPTRDENEALKKRLLDERYAELPPHARPRAVAGHATALMCEQVDDPALVMSIVSALIERESRETTLELSKWWRCACRAGFSSSSSSTGTSSAESLWLYASEHGHGRIFLDSLEETLLASTFEQRYLFSPFVRMTEPLPALFNTLLSVVDVVLRSIDTDIEPGTLDKMYSEIGHRMLKNLDVVLLDLVSESFLEAVIDPVTAFARAHEPLDEYFNADAAERLIEACATVAASSSSAKAGQWREALTPLLAPSATSSNAGSHDLPLARVQNHDAEEVEVDDSVDDIDLLR